MTWKIINPTSAFQTVSDYRTFVNDNSALLNLGTDVLEFLCGGTITKGDLVTVTGPASATTKMNIVSKTTGFYSATVGIAMQSGVSGDVIQVCVEGLCLGNVDVNTPAAGGNAIQDATTAIVGVLATEAVAATIVGTVLGSFLAAKATIGGQANLAPIWYHRT